MINRQKEDQCKYSAQYSNKRNWQSLDYYVWFLYCVWSENMKNCNSLFFNITLTANKVNEIIWQLLQYTFFNQCSSHQKTFTDVKTMNLTSKKKSAKLEKTQETVQNISEDSDLTELTEILKIFDNQSVSQVKDKEAQISVLIIKSEQWLKDDDTLKNKTQHEDDTLKNKTQHDNDTLKNKTQYEDDTLKNKTQHEDNILKNKTQYKFVQSLLSSVNTINTVQHMFLEKTQSNLTSNLTDQYWIHVLMQTASKWDQNWEEIKENLQNSYTDNRMTDIQSVT